MGEALELEEHLQRREQLRQLQEQVSRDTLPSPGLASP
jgi:hypothetical protein